MPSNIANAEEPPEEILTSFILSIWERVSLRQRVPFVTNNFFKIDDQDIISKLPQQLLIESCASCLGVTAIPNSQEN